MHGACGAPLQSWTVSASAQGNGAFRSAQQAHHIPAFINCHPRSITHHPAPFHHPTANILNGSAVTVLLPVVTDIPKFVTAAERQRVFTPRQASAELAAYTLPLGRAAITTVNQGWAVPFCSIPHGKRTPAVEMARQAGRDDSQHCSMLDLWMQGGTYSPPPQLPHGRRTWSWPACAPPPLPPAPVHSSSWSRKPTTCLPGWSRGTAASAATAYCPTSRSAPMAGCVLRHRGGGVGRSCLPARVTAMVLVVLRPLTAS